MPRSEKEILADRAIIEAAGGGMAFAKTIAGKKATEDEVLRTYWRVNTWMSRGIPAQVRLDYPALFATKKRSKK